MAACSHSDIYIVCNYHYIDHDAENAGYSLAVDHGKRCDETPFTECAMSLTFC